MQSDAKCVDRAAPYRLVHVWSSEDGRGLDSRLFGCQPGCLPRDARCVKWSAWHSGQCRNASIDWFSAEIDSTCLATSVESLDSPMSDVTNTVESIRSDLNRRRLAHLGTSQV